MTSNKKIKITQFLDSHCIKWFPVKLNKKVPTRNDFYDGQPTSKWFAEKTDGEIKELHKHLNEFDHIAIDLSRVRHVDVDFVDGVDYKTEEPEAYIFEKKLRKNLPYYKSVSKAKGKHYFTTHDFDTSNNRPKTIFGKHIEVLNGGWAYCKATSKVHNADSDMDFMLPPILPVSKVEPEHATVSTPDAQPKHKLIDQDEADERSQIEQLCDIIDVEYLDSYNDWTRILWALKSDNEEANLKIAKKISQKSSKYDEGGFWKVWNSGKDQLKIGTVFYYARMSNETKFYDIQSEYVLENEFLNTDDVQANLFVKNNSEDVVFKDGKVFMYHKELWREDGCCHLLKNKACTFLKKMLKLKRAKVSTKLSNAPEESPEREKLSKDVEFLSKVLQQILSNDKINSVCKKIVSVLACNDYSHVEFDRNPFYFNFKNKCYDLKSHTFVSRKREDYILTTNDVTHENIKAEDKAELNAILDTIFPDDEIKQNYMHLMSTGLVGIPIEKFVICNGSGGNGKGLINELLCALLGNYAYNAPNQILLRPFKDGSNPAVANMHNKRLIIYREPESEHSKICGSVIKELTGGEKVNARMNYSNDCETKLKGVHILECNKKPLIDGRIDEAYTRRLIDVPFKSTFTTNKDYLAKGWDNVHPANPYYKTDTFKTKFKLVLFGVLTDYMKAYHSDHSKHVWEQIPVCQQIKDRTKKYLEESDNIFELFQLGYELDDSENSFVKINDFHKYIKGTDYYQKMTKKAQRGLTYRYLTEYCESNINFKMFFKERLQIKSDKIDFKNVLLGYKLKPDQDSSDEESEENPLDIY
jgi:phage/plasmid-associated DNA primase